jgi:hypothetical protein
MLALKDWLPDFKGALTGFYQENLQGTLESKTSEFKALLQQNMHRGTKTQRAIITIALAVLLLLALAFFWKDNPQGIPWKYLALGILLSYTTLTVQELRN